MTEIPTLGAREGLKTALATIDQLEKRVADLTVFSRDLVTKNEGLANRHKDNQQKLETAERLSAEQRERLNELEPKVTELTRLLTEEKARADTAVASAEDNRTMADAYEKLEDLTLALLEAFDRLPMTPAEWHMIPTAFRSEIELYATYEWQALSEAKLALDTLLTKGEQHDREGDSGEAP